MISKKDIISMGTKKPEKKLVSGLGDNFVYIKHLSARQRYAWEASAVNDENEVDKSLLADASINLVAMCVCDETGVPLFNSDEVAELDADLVSELRGFCQEVNGLKAKATEEAGKS
jgi:hypothetical protein